MGNRFIFCHFLTLICQELTILWCGIPEHLFQRYFVSYDKLHILPQTKNKSELITTSAHFVSQGKTLGFVIDLKINFVPVLQSLPTNAVLFTSV